MHSVLAFGFFRTLKGHIFRLLLNDYNSLLQELLSSMGI
jgi:hypothetical protein